MESRIPPNRVTLLVRRARAPPRISNNPDSRTTQPAAKGWPVATRAEAARMIMNPIQVTVLGVMEVRDNQEIMGWVIQAAIALRNTCNLAVDT